MKSRYLACSMALVTLLSVSTEATAQTASVPARRLFLYDGGTSVTLNRITLESPDATTLTSNYGLILPPAQGNVNDIMYVQSNSGSNNVLNFTNGSPLFWRVVGNDHAITDGTNNLLGTLTDNRVRFITDGTNTGNTSLMVLGNSGDGYNISMGFGQLPQPDAKLFLSNNGEAGLTTGIRLYSNNVGLEVDAPDAGLIIGANTASQVGIEVRGSIAAGMLVGGFIGGTTPALGISVEASGIAFQAVNSPTSFDGDGNTNLGDGNLDVHTVHGVLNVNSVAGQIADVTIGQTTNGGAVTINTSTTNPLTLDVGVTTNNLVLNNILSTPLTDDVLWITAANQVRRTPFSGLVEQGITFNNEGGNTRIRLGGLANTDNPFLADRYVNLDAYTVNFTANGGALTPVQIVGGATPVINVAGTTNINTVTPATTNIGVAGGTNTITGTNTVLGITDINTSGAATTTIGNAGSVVTVQGGTNNVVGTANINSAAAAATNIGFAGGTNTVLGTTNVNASGSGTTTIGNTASGGAVSISAANPNPITIDVAATTNNLVLNNILNAPLSDDLLWITASNQVRRATTTSTADEGIQFNSGAYRLGHLIDGSNPIVNPRFVRVGPAGTLTFNTNTTTSLVVNGATGAVSINSAGSGTTSIGSAAAGQINLQSSANIVALANNTLQLTSATSDVDITASLGNITEQASLQIQMTGGTGVLATANSGNVQLTAVTGLVNASGNSGVNVTAATNDVTLTATAGQVVVNAGTNVDINATASVTVDGVNITETATTTYALSAPTANINTATASTTTIGNTTNGVVNIRGNGNNGVTITGAQAAPGNNTIVMEIGNTASNLVINNIASVAPIQDLLWITAANEVRRTPFSGTADEGIMFQSSAYRLGGNAVDVNPVVSNRVVTVGAGGTLSFQTAAGANNMLQLNNNGNVAISSAGAATTAIGNASAGTISLNAGGAGNDVTIAANDEITLTSASITGTSSGATTLTAGGLFVATGANGAALNATTNNVTISAAAGQVNANANTTFNATGGTGATVTATTGNVDINASAGQINANANTTFNATGGSGVTVTATTNNVALAASAGQITLDANSATGAVAINATNAAGTIALTAGNTVGITSTANDVNITVPGGASGNDLRLIGIDADATPTHMLTHTATNEVRRTALAGTALEGIVWSSGAFRLGSPTAGNGAGTNPLLVNRFVNLDNFTLTFNRGAGSDAMLTLDAAADAVSVDAATVTVLGSTTNVNQTGSGATTIGNTAAGGAVALASSSTIDANAPTLTLNNTAGYNTAIGNATGTFGLTSTQLNINSATGELSDASGAVTVNDADGLVVNSGAGADLTITEDGLDRGANQITVGATTGSLLLNGTSGTANITAPSLATNVAPAFSHPTDGIVIANGSGVLRRRPITDLINANQGLTYDEGGSAEVRLGSTTDGTNAITSNRFVRVGAGGTLTFTHAGGNMLQLNNNGDVNINTTGAGNTAIGNATGSFGLTSSQLNVNSTNGFISDAVGAVTVQDADGLLVDGAAGVTINTGAAPDLVMTESTISRASANIAINPGASNTVSTDGSASVAVNLTVLGSTTLGDGNDGFAVNSGTGLAQINSTNEIRLTGPTNINNTGSASTTIGDISNPGVVNIRSQASVNLRTDDAGVVNIQTGGQGDVVIGNNPANNDLTINANVRGAGTVPGSNRFAERITLTAPGGGAATFTINNTRVTATGVILLTVEDYSGAGVLTAEINNRVAGTSFDVTFSAALAAGETVVINYMIINP